MTALDAPFNPEGGAYVKAEGGGHPHGHDQIMATAMATGMTTTMIMVTTTNMPITITTMITRTAIIRSATHDHGRRQ